VPPVAASSTWAHKGGAVCLAAGEHQRERFRLTKLTFTAIIFRSARGQ